MPRIAIVIKILGMGNRDAVTQQVESLIEDLGHTGQITVAKQVGCVQYHLEPP